MHKPVLLIIYAGSVDKKKYIIKNASPLKEGIASKDLIYVNADLTIRANK